MLDHVEVVEVAAAALLQALQPVEEDVAQEVEGVAPSLAVEHAAISPANISSMTTSTPWRTITSM